MVVVVTGLIVVVEVVVVVVEALLVIVVEVTALEVVEAACESRRSARRRQRRRRRPAHSSGALVELHGGRVRSSTVLERSKKVSLESLQSSAPVSPHLKRVIDASQATRAVAEGGTGASESVASPALVSMVLDSTVGVALGVAGGKASLHRLVGEGEAVGKSTNAADEVRVAVLVRVGAVRLEN